MNLTKLTLFATAGLAVFISCKKQNEPAPLPQTNCSTCTCIEFDSTGINESFSSTQYGSVFYYQAYAELSGKYADYSTNMSGSGYVDVIPVDAVWQAENTNFSGEILRFADADVLFDYSNYSNASKTVSFDFNLNLGDFTFIIDGAGNNTPPPGVTVNITNLSSGYHVEVSGTFTTLELGGWELAIDNMCVEDYIPSQSNAVCEGYDNMVLNNNCPTTQTNYGTPFMTSNGISFRCKYVDYEGISSLDGSVFWGAPNSSGANENVNFSGQLLQVNNVDLELDFSSFTYTNKRVMFDISNVWDINDVNEFMVNGQNTSTLPAGVTYNTVFLGNAANGNPCYHVEIEGPINTVVLVGWEITYDNLCVEEL